MYYKHIRVNSCSFVVNVFFYLCVLSVFSVANADVKSDMDTLANQAKYTADTFMQKSVELRLGYEYRQGFSSDAQAQSLREHAQKATAEMDEIILAQEKLKKQIENYNGDDWDSRYGDSGVWRMLGSDIATTKILKCRLEYYRAIALGQYEQDKILSGALDKLGALVDTPTVLLIKADMYAVRGKSDQSSKNLAGELYRKVMNSAGVPAEVYYAAAVGVQKLDPPQSLAVLDELAAQLGRSECKDNFELTMSLAFLQRRLGRVAATDHREVDGSTAILEKATKRWPRAKVFVGDLVVSDLATKTPPQVSKLSVFEADCVATAMMQKDAPKYPDVLEAMSQIPRLQTPRLLNAAAVAQSQKSPARAIELFIKASVLPREPNDGYEPPVNLAKQGATVALNYFSRGDRRSPSADPNRCELVKRAVENYFSLAGNARDQEIEYPYSDVLADCGDKMAAEKLLQEIAAGSNSEFARRAKADLSALAISKSQALLQHEKLSEAAKVLIATDVNVCECLGLSFNLLVRYVDRLDENTDSNSTIEAFSVIGRRLLDCPDTQMQGKPYTLVLYVQAAVFAQGQSDKLDALDKLFGSLDKTYIQTNEKNVDLLAARARLAAAQGKYEEAATQWGTICGILKSEADEPPQHSWHWWQAKYFELANSLKMPNASRSDITHSIEVLQSSFNQIPPFWAKKFELLKAH